MEDEKSELIDVMDNQQEVAENPNLMAIAIEFRLKPLILMN